MTGPGNLVDEADRATASGKLGLAEQLLRDASQAAPDDLSIFLKLAALQRAAGRFEMALESVHRALSINPLEFTALLLRASLLDRLGQPGAPEAWSHALAQKPDGEIPAHLQAVVSNCAGTC